MNKYTNANYISEFITLHPYLTFPYLPGEQPEQQLAQRWGHFDAGPVRIPDVTKVTLTFNEALANRNRFDGDILHSFWSCSV